SPTFNDNKEVDNYSEDDSVNGAEEINGDISKQMNLDDETDIECVLLQFFDDKADSLGMNTILESVTNEKENSSEEFQHVDAQEVQGIENSLSKRRLVGLSSRVLEDAQPLNEHASPSIDSKKKQVARYWRAKYMWCLYWPLSLSLSQGFAMEYICPVSSRWDGHCLVMGDFNEVRCMEDRLGSVYDAQAQLFRQWGGGVDTIGYLMLVSLIGNLKFSGWEKVTLLKSVLGSTLFINMSSIRKIPRTCSSVADWLRISSGSYAAGGIYHGRPLVHMLIGLIGSIPSD
ncbi:hypothetical protein Tco_1034456, partial [Tanacetum coccineum]